MKFVVLVNEIRYKAALVLLLMGILCDAIAIKDTVPSWLDTIPPKITIDPVTKWHASVFHITFKSNERANISYGINSKDKFKLYNSPLSITKDGKYIIYYYAEDDFANKSKLDSAIFVLDQKPPHLSIMPTSGVYPQKTVIRLKSDKPCIFNLHKTPSDSVGKLLGDTLILNSSFDGFITATDSSGNRTISEHLSFIIDTSSIIIEAKPPEGTFNKIQTVEFISSNKNEIYYTIDPLIPQNRFTKYVAPFELPHGLTILRYYGKNNMGTETEIFHRKYIIDTIPPKIIAQISKGLSSDTIFLSTKKQSSIHYEFNKAIPSMESNLYVKPIIISHHGKCVFKARAWDNVGNASDVYKWECKYEFDPPVLKSSSNGGTFTKRQIVFITSTKPAKIFYTLDGSKATENSFLYNSAGILISREDSTILSFIGIDDADNRTEEKQVRFFLDTRPPQVKVRINGSLQDGCFFVNLTSNEPAQIHYEIGGADPVRTSPVYSTPIPMKAGQILKFYAIDLNGNCSDIVTVDELKKARVEAVPTSGIYNKRLKISFLTTTAGTVQWRLLPDTVFKPFTDTISINQEGNFSFEYFIEGQNGIRSPIRRNEYTLDWTAPHVEINIKKTNKDSIAVFFDASENATIYYTTDGTNPVFSPTTKIAGNKYLQSRDRIVIPRSKDSKLAFFAEDIAKNQSKISVLDVLSPKAIPNVPAGLGRLYDRILSVTLNTVDQSTIYFCRHGKVPTVDSSVYMEPLTLLKSDTIVAFVVDASGYKGQLDTFIYQIDLPPSPQFSVKNDTILAGRPVVFDASESIDKETPFDRLSFKWDFDGDGKFDTESGKFAKVSHIYPVAGNYTAILEVEDENHRTAQISRIIMVGDICPYDMISVNGQDGKHFCIDMYEWPNLQNKIPQTQVSWVEAKMSCIDAGKRLCSAKEWETACKGLTNTVYPYGNKYDMKRCPTEGKTVYKSGSFKNCNELKVQDMIGNTWEWVEDKHGDYPQMYGGSYKDGKNAYCGLSADGFIASRSGEIGFRCCK